MVIKPFEIVALQARVDANIAEFRAAQQRRLVKQGIDLWNRTEASQRRAAQVKQPPTKVN